MLDVLAHQDREDLVGLGRVLDRDLEQDPAGRVHRGVPQLVGIHLTEALVALDRVLLGQLLALLETVPHQRVALGVGVDELVLGRLVPTQAVERWLGHVDVAVLDQGFHETEQQRQQQRVDVVTVHVGVGHQHDLVVAHLLDAELLVDPGAEGGDDRLHLGVAQDLVDARLLDVEDLAADGKDRLYARVAALAGGAAGRVALDDEDLALLRVGRLAVAQLAGQAATTEQALASAGQVARLAGSDARHRRGLRLADDVLALGRVLLEPGTELVVDDALSEALDLGVAQLGLGLALELRVLHLDRDDRRQALADVVTGDAVLLLLDLSPLLAPVVDQARERRTEALLVGAALVGVDRVGEGVHRLGERGVPLHRDLEAHVRPGVARALGLEGDDRRVGLVLAAVEVLDVVDQASLVLEDPLQTDGRLLDRVRRRLVDRGVDGAVLDSVGHLVGVLALVADDDLEALVQEGHLPNAAGDRLEVVGRRLEDVL